MPRTQHYVVPHLDQWEVRTNDPQGDADMPRYDKREDAVAAAILSAQNAYEEGYDAEVLVQDPSGEYRVERSYDASR